MMCAPKYRWYCFIDVSSIVDRYKRRAHCHIDSSCRAGARFTPQIRSRESHHSHERIERIRAHRAMPGKLSRAELLDIQAEFFAEDVPLTEAMCSWTIDEVTTYFESGGRTAPLRAANKPPGGRKEDKL